MSLLFRLNVSLLRRSLQRLLFLRLLYDDFFFLHLAPRLIRALRMRDHNKVRGMERGALKEQLAVCRLYAARCGYHVVRIIFQQSNEPSVRRLSRCPAENIIIAKPSVLGSPYHFLWRRQQLNLAGKRVLCAMQISLQEETA